MEKLIAICGGIGAGKDTVGWYLRKHHGYAVVSFAEPLKELAAEFFGQLGVEGRHFFGTQEDKAAPIPEVVNEHGTPRTGRQILEHLGTEGFRHIDPDIWVKIAMARVDAETGRPCVITDGRFPNELDAVKARGGEVWLIEKTGGQQEATGHSSDLAWRSWLVENNPDHVLIAKAGDIDGLLVQAVKALTA